MTQREKLLVSVVSTLVVGVIGYYVWDSVDTAWTERLNRKNTLADEVSTKRGKILRGKRAAKQMAEWDKHSLPTGPDHGATAYQNYLVALVDKSGLTRVTLDANRAVARGAGAYQLLTFNLRARGSLSNMTSMLDQFYRDGHLHQLRRLNITPIQETGELELAFNIECISTPGAAQSKGLTAPPVNRLASATVREYQETIGKRRLFSVYEPPPPPPRPPRVRETPPTPPPPPPFDAAKFAVVSALLHVDGKPEAWILERTTGKRHVVHEGEELKVGLLSCQVSKITATQLELDAEGNRQVVRLGGKLRQ